MHVIYVVYIVLFIYSALIVHMQYQGRSYFNKVFIIISIIIMLSYYRILLKLVHTSFCRITRSQLKWTREVTYICNRKVRSPHCRSKTRNIYIYI